MISKVNKSNKALYEARLAEINRLLHEQNLISSDEVVDTLESYYQHIVEIQKLPVRYVDPDTGEAYKSKYLLMPLDEPLFQIDANKRSISVPADFAKNGVGVKGDHRAEVLYFVIDRYFDARDLYDGTDYIIINWQFRGVNDSRNKELETHTSIALAPDDTYIPGSIVFGWVIDNEMTPSKGTLSFSVSFVSKNADNTYSYALNTTVASVIINDSLCLKDPSILSSLKRPVFERLRNSEFTPDSVDPVKLPVWRTGQNVIWDEEEGVSGLSGLPLIANFDFKNGDEVDTVLLQAVGAVTDQEGVNLKYTWSGMQFADGESVGREPEIVREAEGPSVETDWVLTSDTVAQPGIVYWTGDGRVKTRLSIEAGENLPEGKNVYELGSSLEVSAAGDYLVEMQGVRMGATSRSVPSKHCIIPHAAIPEVTLKVAGVAPSDVNNGYEIDNPDIASEFTFVDDNAPSVKAIVTKDEKNVRGRNDIVGVEVVAKKLMTVPNDANAEVSQANQDAIEIKQKDNVIMIVGHLNELNSYLSTNEYQASLGASKWIAIDLGTNISDITKLTWNGSPLTQEDAQEAIALGLDEGHIIFWVRAEQLPKVIKIGRAGYADSEYKVVFVDAADYIEDEEFDADKALENARLGILKESELGKIAFIIADGESEPSINDFDDAEWTLYEDNMLFDIPSNNASAEGTYCVYAANKRNHSMSISERSDLIKVSKIAPKLSNITVTVEDASGFNFVLIENNETKMRQNEQTGASVPTVYNMSSDGAHCKIVIGDSFADFKDNVELQLTVKEIDRDAWETGDLVFTTAENEVPYEYSVDSNNEFIISASDPGLFVIEAITKYNGVKRTTYTEPLYLSNT